MNKIYTLYLFITQIIGRHTQIPKKKKKNHTQNIKIHTKKKIKKPINLSQNYKKEPHKKRFIKMNNNTPREREREREREYSRFCVRKYRLNGRNYIKYIQNKMGRRRIKI